MGLLGDSIPHVDSSARYPTGGPVLPVHPSPGTISMIEQRMIHPTWPKLRLMRSVRLPFEMRQRYPVDALSASMDLRYL